jgi:predicted nuclease with RNAse H fold
MSFSKNYFMGIDVQSNRDCPYAVFNESLQMVASGWISSHRSYGDLISDLCSKYRNLSVGLDCPRMPLPALRKWYWRNGRWEKRTTQSGYGRHCEVVIKAHNIANPQWTPTADKAPEWMRIGFSLFREFESKCLVYEAFPSASYHILHAVPEVSCTLSFDNFRPGPKDMLDAAVAAVTVFEFSKGRGCEVGGGDGQGTIILPRPIPDLKSEVLHWPG